MKKIKLVIAMLALAWALAGMLSSCGSAHYCPTYASYTYQKGGRR